MQQTHSRSRIIPWLAPALFALACGGADQPVPAADPAPTVVAHRPAAGAAGPVDPGLADRGSTLFTERACTACHTIGSGRLVGPDLSGVTQRRTPEWIVAMITNPDSMVRADATAKQLFAEYMTPMANQGISASDAAALLEFLRRSDAAN